MTMEYKDLLKLARFAANADRQATMNFSFNGKEEKYSVSQVNQALGTALDEMLGSNRKAGWRENKNTIFTLIEESIDEAIVRKVEDAYLAFADVKQVPQGDKPIFHTRITEAAKKRAKSFVTRVGLAGRYETFILDGRDIEVQTAAIGGAARIGFEEFLDGRIQFSELTEIILEGIDEYIYKEIGKALASLVSSTPSVQKATYAGFDEDTMDELLGIADSYGLSAIYCTREFASKMIPASQWASNEMKNRLWEQGLLGNYKGHQVIVLPQSMTDETNTTKVIDPSYAYIIPAGTEKPIKLAFEGETAVRTVEDNDDWSMDFQAYKKFGIAVLANSWMCVYQNTNLHVASRSS